MVKHLVAGVDTGGSFVVTLAFSGFFKAEAACWSRPLFLLAGSIQYFTWLTSAVVCRFDLSKKAEFMLYFSFLLIFDCGPIDF